MRRDLPPRPHLDHLKKQAKELLDAHRRGEPEALDRIREALPALLGRTREEVARAAFALHDAQSTLAREYGFRCWRELREVVQRQGNRGPGATNVRALLEGFTRSSPVPLPEDVMGLIIERLQDSARHERLAEALRAELPETLPLLAVRNHLVLSASVAPLHVGRPISRAAIDAALRSTPATLAVVAQQFEADQEVVFERLHPIGCQALVHAVHPDGQGNVFVVIETLRPIAVRAVEPQAGAALFARVSPFELDFTDGADELLGLDRTLRSYAKQLAGMLPEPESAAAALEALDEGELADAVVANLPCTVSDKAQYAAEPKLVERVRTAIRLVERMLEAARTSTA